MQRREFISLAGLASATLARDGSDVPKYRVVSAYQAAAQPGMPGRYPGQVVAVHSERSIQTGSDKVDVPTVQGMMSAGMRMLTGDKDVRDSWARFISSSDT